MPLIPFPLNEFGGLNLVIDPTDAGVGYATDLLNVSMDRPNRLRTRDGCAKFSTSATTGAIRYMVPLIDSVASPRLITWDSTNVYAIDLSTGVRTSQGSFGGTITNMTRPTLYPWDPNGPMALVAVNNGTAGQGLWAADGAGVFTAVAGAVNPQYACMVPYRAPGGLAPRLATAGYFAAVDAPGGLHGSPSTVFFSDPPSGAGAPTFTSSNWVQLDPDDGEKITGMVAWNGSLYVFKSSKAYIFFNESLDGSGNPIFNYRRVELRDPIPRVTSPTAWQPVAVGPDGVYYTGTTGLWRVANEPTRVNTPVDPILAGTADSTFAVGTVGQVRMEWAGPMLFIAYTLGSAAQRLLVWDTRTNTWTLHAYAQTVSSLPMFAPTFGSALFFGASDGFAYKISPASTTDNGTAIAWSYTTGYSSAGGYYRQRIISSGERKNHFKVDILGSGTVTHQVLTLNGRPNDVADPGGSVTLGTSPALARGERRRGARGTHIAHKLSGSGQAVVSGMTYWLQGVEQDT